MTVYVVVGQNLRIQNISARAVYSKYEDALAHLSDKRRMWFDDHAAVIPLELDGELAKIARGDATVGA